MCPLWQSSLLQCCRLFDVLESKSWHIGPFSCLHFPHRSLPLTSYFRPSLPSLLPLPFLLKSAACSRRAMLTLIPTRSPRSPRECSESAELPPTGLRGSRHSVTAAAPNFGSSGLRLGPEQELEHEHESESRRSTVADVKLFTPVTLLTSCPRTDF